MIFDDQHTHNSQLIVELAESALRNLSKDEVRRYKHNADESIFRDEFRTVRVSLPRQSGHTTAALRLVVNYPGSLMFVERETYKMDALRLLRGYTDNPEVIANAEECIVPIYNPNRILRLKPQPLRNFIVFDESNRFKEESMMAVIHSVNAHILVVLR